MKASEAFDRIMEFREQHGAVPRTASVHPDDVQFLTSAEIFIGGHGRISFAHDVMGVTDWFADSSVPRGDIQFAQ